MTKKAILAWVFSVIVSVGMLAIPGRALAHDHDGGEGGWHGHDRGWHRGWDNHSGWGNQRGRGWGGDEDEEEEEEHEHRGYYQQPYGYGYQPYGYGYQAPYQYGYGRRRYGYRLPSNGAGMVNPRHPGLVWSCDSQGHHCHWARRYGYNNTYPQGALNPFAFNGAYNGNGYYGNNYGGYGNGYYGNAPMGGLGTLLGPLLGQPY
jgi:hypothetical protein